VIIHVAESEREVKQWWDSVIEVMGEKRASKRIIQFVRGREHWFSGI
jgi:hypothetical protein